MRKNTAKTYTDQNGYRRFKNSGLSVARYAAEKKLGRPLKRGEVVHHINRNKRDNSPRNLWVFPNQRAHWAAHQSDARRYGRRFSLRGRF